MKATRKELEKLDPDVEARIAAAETWLPVDAPPWFADVLRAMYLSGHRGARVETKDHTGA